MIFNVEYWRLRCAAVMLAVEYAAMMLETLKRVNKHVNFKSL